MIGVTHFIRANSIQMHPGGQCAILVHTMPVASFSILHVLVLQAVDRHSLQNGPSQAAQEAREAGDDEVTFH